MNRTIVLRADSPGDLTPDQVDGNFRGLDQDLAAAEGAVSILGMDLQAVQQRVQTLEGKGGGRAAVSVTTDVIKANGTAYADAPLGMAYVLLKLEVSSPARVRIYQTAAHRAADAGRPAGTVPVDDHGLVAEAVLTGGLLSRHFGPLTLGANQEALPSAWGFLSITNMDVTSKSVTVTVTRLVLETPVFQGDM